MEILFGTLLLLFSAVVWLLLVAMACAGYYFAGKLILKNTRRAFLRTSTARVTAYDMFTPDLAEGDAEDERPLLHLQLACERGGQLCQLKLGPVSCQELFLALGQPRYRSSCWMTDDDWRDLLEGRELAVACDFRHNAAFLLNQMQLAREILIGAIIAVAVLTLAAVAQA
ncbi:MAG: hypothetical protein ACN6O6_12645 [Pseudomonas sp.]|uniref:hypothetical protein n=1 Tax=Pseudomonas sp. TaxID=306 RepID=UPI003D145D95